MNTSFLIALASLVALPALSAPSVAPGVPASEMKGQDSVMRYLDLAEALKRKGDPDKGKTAYEVCRGCHKADASGRPDAGYPQLAGQHATVLIKQMLDVRSGHRDNPRMHPFIEQEAVAAKDIPDVAAYLNSLPLLTNNRKGDGNDLVRGKGLYDRDCAACHGDVGEGDVLEFIPKVSGQHYPYLYRENLDIRDMQRRNANARMVKVLQKYTDEDIAAVSDYMSRLSATPQP